MTPWRVIPFRFVGTFRDENQHVKPRFKKTFFCYTSNWVKSGINELKHIKTMNDKRQFLPKSELLKILQNNHIGEIMHEYAERVYVGGKCYLLEKKCIRGRYMYAIRNDNEL